MRFRNIFVLSMAVGFWNAASAFAASQMTCDEAQNFLYNDSYTCDLLGSDCSSGECVDTAKCRYTGGVAGFTVSFAYPTDCGFAQTEN